MPVTTAVSVVADSSAPSGTPARAIPTATPTKTPTSTATTAPTRTPTTAPTSTPTTIPTRTPTATPTDTLEAASSPSSTPTLGPRVTRTPAPPEVCPASSEQTPVIVAIRPGTAIVEGFEPQIKDYLDNGGSVDGLRDALSGLTLTDADGTSWLARTQVVAVDVTGNTTPDVVVALTFFVEGQYADGGLFVYRCQGGQYQGGAVSALGGQVLSAAGPDPGIRAIQDMNGDGVPEIVFSYIEIIGTHANFTRLFRIVEWDGSQFVDLIQSDSYRRNTAPVYNGDGVVLDAGGNRDPELVLTNGVGHYYGDGGPERQRTDVWAWDGYAVRLARREYEPPIYRFQSVQDGDDAAQSGDYGRALALYGQAISDEGLLGWSQGQLWPDSVYGTAPTPTPDPDERARLSAYAYYRTMLVHVALGNMSEASSAYGTLQEQFLPGTAGHPYAQLATVFWEAYNAHGDLVVACNKAVEHATAHAGEILAPLGSEFYGFNNRDYAPDDICIFR